MVFFTVLFWAFNEASGACAIHFFCLCACPPVSVSLYKQFTTAAATKAKVTWNSNQGVLWRS